MKTPFSYYIAEKAAICEKNCRIDQKLYDEYGVKKGLRDKNGTGVLAGITNISQTDIQYAKALEMKIKLLVL